MNDILSPQEEARLSREQHEATMAFARDRRERIYRLHRDGMSDKQIARRIGGLAPYRVRRIIAAAERERGASQ